VTAGLGQGLFCPRLRRGREHPGGWLQLRTLLDERLSPHLSRRSTKKQEGIAALPYR